LIAAAVCACCSSTHAPGVGERGEAPLDRGAFELVRESVELIRAHALGASLVDWDEAERVECAGLPAAAVRRAAWPAVAGLVARLDDPHARFFDSDEVERWRQPSAAPQTSEAGPDSDKRADASPGTERPDVPTRPAARRLESDFGYVLVPSCNALRVEELRDYALVLRRAVLEVARSDPRGWIVDLRFNGGGNVWPMLAGLRPLLGDGEAARSVSAGGLAVRSGCDGGRVWLDQGRGEQVQLEIEPPAEDRVLAAPRVAVLVHGWTMSSGELVACAFLGRDGVRVFGEPTAGLTTATEFFPLSDGSLLVLPTSRMADRTGRVWSGPLAPDELVTSVDWPSASDGVAQSALRWLRDD
jgi:C-terminal processing protease CtpA/Prc